METIYKRLIGLFLAMPGLVLLYLAYLNNSYGVTLSQIMIFIIGAFISLVVTIMFFYGAWLFIMGPED